MSGENTLPPMKSIIPKGSSPRERGKLVAVKDVNGDIGLIPA